MRAVIVGSGATGVHFAATLLERGHDVLMRDVGHERPAPVSPQSDFDGLKDTLEDPAGYFLGEHGEAVVYPGPGAKFYGFPPSKTYVFNSPKRFVSEEKGFSAVTSFAAGGLAEAWTGGVYPLNDAELADFPFDYSALAPHYATVARRIGISAVDDDLARFAPFSPEYQPALEVDPHSQLLLTRYGRARSALNKRGFYLGRSRVAVLSRDLGDRQACDYLGRCLWGCPRDSLYAPSVTLRELKRHPRFRYAGGVFVDHLVSSQGRIERVRATPLEGGEPVEFTGDLYVLAAGALCSARIVLETHYRATGAAPPSTGLMDNQQLMIPFITLPRLGQRSSTHSYQFHQIALGIAGQEAKGYVHGQITALKAASVHPIVQSMPVDTRSALAIFRATHAALGVANVWLHDTMRPGNQLSIRPGGEGERTSMVLTYRPGEGDDRRVAATLKTMKRALRKLGAIVPPGMTKILPPGSSIHYAGTLPMTAARGSFTCDASCRSHDWENLYFADGASFPFLPAKNLTYTLMANAIRVASSL
jgi:choline dehydrogenase-like flavoprotein